MNDVILNKTQVIQRCLQRIREEYDDNEANLSDYTKQDSIILNIQRACEASIDLAMHIISEKNWGLPQTSRAAFDILQEHQAIPQDVADRMKAMVGFRNIAVHDYQTINLTIVQKVIEEHLGDFEEYSQYIMRIL